MEGKSAACAHLSSVGNIAACVADMWSNESVQNVRLLSDMAPTVSMEQLVYDCRLFNAASADGEAARMQKWLANSDSRLSPQAYVLRPDVVLRLSEKIAEHADPYQRTIAGARAAIEEIGSAYRRHELNIWPREEKWIGLIQDQLDEIPDTEEEMIDSILPELKGSFLPAEYGL